MPWLVHSALRQKTSLKSEKVSPSPGKGNIGEVLSPATSLLFLLTSLSPLFSSPPQAVPVSSIETANSVVNWNEESSSTCHQDA